MNIDGPDDFDKMMALLAMSDALTETPSKSEAGDTGVFDIPLAGPDAAGCQSVAVRLDKVALVRAALLAGTYRVSAQAVAGKMLDAMFAIQRKRVSKDRRQRPRVGHRGVMRGRLTSQS